MTRSRATLVAAALTVVAYVGVAWLVSGIEIPPDAPTALSPWLRPFRVVATLGFGLANTLHMPHVAGQFLAAIALGSLLGALFASLRHWLQ